MGKAVIVFVIGLGLGYSYGFHEAAAGSPSAMQHIMGRFGVYRIQADQERRDRAIDAVTK